MKTRTIAFICPPVYWGGLEMNVLRLARWLTKRGHRIILYGNPRGILYGECRSQNIEVRPLVSRSKLTDIPLAIKLAKMIRQDNAKIVILHTNKNFLLSVLAKRLSRQPFKLLYMQAMHVGGTKKDFFHNWEYGHLDAWVTPLPLLKRLLIQKTNLDPNKIEIIPFGIEHEPFTDRKPDKPAARRRLGLPEHATIAGIVGRLDFQKGQHILIEACHKLHRQGHQVHLLFVGAEPARQGDRYVERLTELIDEFGLTDFVHFLPYMPEVEYAYAALDIFVLASKSETYGMVTLEAMASQLPVIATNEGGTRDIIRDGVNGLLVEPFNVDHLQNALLRILKNPDLAGGLAKQAQNDAVSNYSYQSQCNLLENLMAKLMG